MQDCVFCKIVAKEIPSEVIYEDDKTIAFKDLDPQAPIHILIIPTAHYQSVLNVPAGNDIISHIHSVANRLAVKYSLCEKGFRLVTNVGSDAGQSVAHLHYHFLAGRSFSWPPG